MMGIMLSTQKEMYKNTMSTCSLMFVDRERRLSQSVDSNKNPFLTGGGPTLHRPSTGKDGSHQDNVKVNIQELSLTGLHKVCQELHCFSMHSILPGKK